MFKLSDLANIPFALLDVAFFGIRWCALCKTDNSQWFIFQISTRKGSPKTFGRIYLIAEDEAKNFLSYDKTKFTQQFGEPELL
jgi:hypothetical protein